MSLRQLSDDIWVVTGGSFPSNTYICRTEANTATLIDSGLDVGMIERALHTLGLSPDQIICTHGHFDHIASAKHFQDTRDATVFLHEGDAKTAKSNNFLLMATKRPERIEQPELTLVGGEFSTSSGGRTFSYRHTPGHTPGSCLVAWGSDLFTGDTLYSRGVGLSKLPGEKHDQLRDSILAVWENLDAYRIHPGHGPSAAGSEIKSTNGRLRNFLGLDESSGTTAWDGSDVNGHF